LFVAGDIMEVRITNVYNDNALPGRGFKAGHGESFHIAMEGKQVLLDVGWKGRKLMNNMKKLGMKADYIDKLVFSHGHLDHTDGLPTFLKARKTAEPLQVIGHPDILEPKSMKLLFFYVSAGFPHLASKLGEKVKFDLSKESVEVLPNLHTTGEIPLAERPEKPGIVSGVFHKVDGQRKWDPVLDDLSLILQSKDGLVVITGCCHAGLLNTCAKATRLFNRKIKAIFGGTHMLEYSEEDVEHVGEVLKDVYGTPELYLNHCTGNKAIEFLKRKFGSETVHDCYVGTVATFEA
jgi:7,8-dihydropterin-6-yl-methyl-4-(beta-D-ribofuranosyl)aminobenzene 5'-phosphate synthase